MTLIETLLYITIAVAVNGSMILFFMYAGFRLLNWGMDYMGLPRATPPPPQEDEPISYTIQASNNDDDLRGGVVYFLSDNAPSWLVHRLSSEGWVVEEDLKWRSVN